MRVKSSNNVFIAEDKEVSVMPTIELIEYERIAYIKGMEEYLDNLKRMTKTEAKKISHENLVKSHILQENGEFTERYSSYTQITTQK